MENSLKQRIIGAVVLIALAVIFLPSILKEKEQQEPFISKIPAKPIETAPKKLPDEIVAKNQQTQQALDELANSTRKSKVEMTDTQDPINKDQTNQELNQDDNKDINKNSSDIKSDVKPISTNLSDNQSTVSINESEQQSNLKPVDNSAKETSAETIGKEFQQAAWIIQIASFSNKENAVNFVETLQKAGHKAYRQEIKNNKNKTIYRIYTGPYIRKEEAEKALSKVNELTKLSGIIMTFDPTQL